MLTDVDVPSTCTLCHSVTQKRIETPAHTFYPRSDPKLTPRAIQNLRPKQPPPINKPHTVSLNLLGKCKHHPSLHCPSFVSTPNPKDLVLQLLLGIQQDQQFAVVLKGCNFESAMCPLHMQSPLAMLSRLVSFQRNLCFQSSSTAKTFVHCI